MVYLALTAPGRLRTIPPWHFLRENQAGGAGPPASPQNFADLPDLEPSLHRINLSR